MKVSLLISVFCVILISMFARAQATSKKIKPDPVLIEEDNNLKIFQVRRVIALKDDEKNPKEFYINGGTDMGIRPGYTVEVTRRNSFYDSLRNQNIGDMLIPVGRVKIIHASPLMSVARIDKVYSSARRPSLEYETFLVGDRLDISTLKSKKTSQRKARKRRSVAQVKKKKPKVISLRAYDGEEENDFLIQDPIAAPVRQ